MSNLEWVEACINQAVLELQNNHKCLIKDVQKLYVPRKESVEIHIYFDYDELELRWDSKVNLEDLISPDTIIWQFLKHRDEYLKSIHHNVEEALAPPVE